MNIKKLALLVLLSAGSFMSLNSTATVDCTDSGKVCEDAREHNLNVTVKLSMSQAEYKAADAQILSFTLTNETEVDITVLKWFTPLDGINSNIFKVELEERPITYIGRIVKRAPFSAAILNAK